MGLLLSVAALPVLILTASARHDARLVVAAVIYGISLILLYSTSTLYHALPGERVKAVMRRCDHAAIYLLIAGTYTPFLLGPMRGRWGWSMFGVIWVLAATGVLFKAVYGVRMPHLSTVLYVAMGWLVVIAVVPMVQHVPRPGLELVLAGGLLYTGGVAFYVYDHRIRFGHAMWHLCVLGGSAAHFWAVLAYAMVTARS